MLVRSNWPAFPSKCNEIVDDDNALSKGTSKSSRTILIESFEVPVFVPHFRGTTCWGRSLLFFASLAAHLR